MLALGVFIFSLMEFPHDIRAVTFDVGGTLIRPWPSVGDVYSEVAARHGKKIHSSLLNQRFKTAWRGLKNFHHSREEWSSLVDTTFADLLEAPPSTTFFDELYDAFSEPKAWRIFDDVLPAIDALAARGINLGIISNWDERLQPLLAKMGLSKYFETIIVSCDVGFTKPSPVIFEHTSKKMGVAPEFILHVGDSEEHDVKGAKDAGFQTLLIDRSVEEAAPGMIKSLLALEQI